MNEVENQEITGCGKAINPHRVCGDISFANKLILCEECDCSESVHNAKGESQ